MMRPNFERLTRDQLLHLVEMLDGTGGRSRFATLRAWQAEQARETGEILCLDCKDISRALGIPRNTTALRQEV